VARATRTQRRALREQRTASAPPAPPRRPTANGGDDGRQGPERRPSRGSFIRESWAELNKVEWPGQSQVIQATIVVLIACIVVGAYLFANDKLWQPVVQRLVGQ
jgi:preprotein translocase SecE subunit